MINPNRLPLHGCRAASLLHPLFEFRFQRAADECRSDIDQFHISFPIGISITALMCFVKSVNEVRYRHRQFVRLTAVSQIHEIHSVDFTLLKSLGQQVRHCDLMQFRKSKFQFGAGPIGPNQERSRIVLSHVRQQKTERGESARKLRYDDASHTQGLRKVSGMQATRTAKAKEREIARIISSFHGDQPDRLFHIIVHDIDNALRKFFKILPPLCPLVLAKYRFNAIQRKRHRPTQKEAWQQSAENHVRVGYCEPSASAIANRSWIGAGALWSDLQGAPCIQFRNRSSTGSDCMNINHRNADRHSINLAFMGTLDFILEKRHVCGCAAHIESDDLQIPASFSNMERPDDATCRPRKNRPDGGFRSGFSPHRSAIRLHDTKGIVWDALGKLAQIAAHERREVSVDDGSRSALVLPILRKDVA